MTTFPPRDVNSIIVLLYFEEYTFFKINYMQRCSGVRPLTVIHTLDTVNYMKSSYHKSSNMKEIRKLKF